ncbi:TPA: hypothetical protein KEV01_001158 [Citrobacter koseri]|nr:hypothetical protein [Citrobacter koseri]
MPHLQPELSEVILFVRDVTGIQRATITGDTLLESDQGIAGDDGTELLTEAEKVFGVSFPDDIQAFRTLFSLQENEYLFTAEGIDLLGIVRLINWLRGIPRPVITDLSFGKLCRVLAELRQDSASGET